MSTLLRLETLLADTLDSAGMLRAETLLERAARHEREALLSGDVRKLARAAIALGTKINLH